MYETLRNLWHYHRLHMLQFLKAPLCIDTSNSTSLIILFTSLLSNFHVYLWISIFFNIPPHTIKHTDAKLTQKLQQTKWHGSRELHLPLQQDIDQFIGHNWRIAWESHEFHTAHVKGMSTSISKLIEPPFDWWEHHLILHSWEDELRNFYNYTSDK